MAEQAVEFWEPLLDPPAQPRRIEGPSSPEGDPYVPGLAVDLEEIWAG